MKDPFLQERVLHTLPKELYTVGCYLPRSCVERLERSGADLMGAPVGTRCSASCASMWLRMRSTICRA